MISGRLEANHTVGTELTVKIITLAYTEDGMPEIVGEVSSRTRRQIMVEERERSIQTLLNTIDDELTGLEVQDISGKGRGVKVRAERLRARNHSFFQAVRVFKKGEPVLEYTGELLQLGRTGRKSAAIRREENNYNFYFCSGGYQFW